MDKWLLNSAKVIGLSHIEDKIPCQDDVITVNKNNVYTAVLSDGCGSAHFSHFGSKIVVEKVSEYLCNNFDDLYDLDEDSIRKTIVELVLENVNKFAKDNIKDIDDYFNTDYGKRNYNKVNGYEIMHILSKEDSQKLLFETLYDATVLFVAIKDDRCLIGHCGDGFILGYKNEEFLILSEEPKIGERNETNYPSSVYNLSKAYNDEKYWELFRIIKENASKYLGFILMSDGSERSLISFKKDGSYPIINNNKLLFEIVYNEKPEDATNYLYELLEKTYRERVNNDGDLVEITDDDVSVALIVSTNYKVSNSELVENGANNIDENLMFYDERLRKLLSKKGILDDEKYNWLDGVFKKIIDRYSGTKFGIGEFCKLLVKDFNADIEDITQIVFYGRKSEVLIKNNSEIIVTGGDSSAN